jgi:hypothetical protein
MKAGELKITHEVHWIGIELVIQRYKCYPDHGYLLTRTRIPEHRRLDESMFFSRNYGFT